jgi:hypothetical protein
VRLGSTKLASGGVTVERGVDVMLVTDLLHFAWNDAVIQGLKKPGQRWRRVAEVVAQRDGLSTKLSEMRSLLAAKTGELEEVKAGAEASQSEMENIYTSEYAALNSQLREVKSALEVEKNMNLTEITRII